MRPAAIFLKFRYDLLDRVPFIPIESHITLILKPYHIDIISMEDDEMRGTCYVIDRLKIRHLEQAGI